MTKKQKKMLSRILITAVMLAALYFLPLDRTLCMAILILASCPAGSLTAVLAKRYSKQRELVMQTVENLCDHPTAEEIYDTAAKECPGLSLGTVYRNLNSLVEAGRVRRVSVPGKADRFDHTLPWHSHLYCTVCGSVTDAEVDEKQVTKLVRGQKGRVQDCAVVFIGVCESCCAAQKAASEA